MSMQGDPFQIAVDEFCETHIVPYADQWDREQFLPDILIEELAKVGWLVPTLSQLNGGAGLDNQQHAIITESLGGACQSVRNLIAVQGMVAHAILRWGSPAQSELWAARIARGQALASFALTEPQGGSNAKKLTTSIEIDGDSLVLNGRKCWISFAERADVILVIGRINEVETGAVILKADSAGLDIQPVQGLLGFRASHLGHITLTNCRVDAECLVAKGPFLFQTLVTGALDYGRFSTASGCVGLSQACLDLSRAFTGNKDRAETSLDNYQAVQGKLADMLIYTEASRLMVQNAARLRDANSPQAIRATLIAKYFASHHARRIASDAVQLHGAIGVSAESSVQRYMRDSKINEIIEGANDMLLSEISHL